MAEPCLRPRRWVGFVPIAVFLMPVVFAAPADPIRIRVSQESRAGRGDFDRHILGHIGAMASGAGVDEVYAYNELSRFSFNGERPVLQPDVSHLFFVEASEGLTLFIVHDAVDNPDGGSAAMRIQVVGNRNETRFLVQDDAFSESDTYAVKENRTDFYTWHNWYACCTDGVVLGPFAGRWKIYIQFISDANGPGGDVVDGLGKWEALSNEEHIRLELERGRRVLLEPTGSFVLLQQHLRRAAFTTRLHR